MEDKFEKIKNIVEKELNECSAHDINHVMRVYNLALNISEGEDVDLEVIKAAALLHDIGGKKEMEDPTGNTDHAVESAKMAKPILKELDFSDDKIKHICNCIISHRYRTVNKPKTKEAEIIFDADKLEIVGAIGIGRSFYWNGKNNAHLYRKINIEEYIKENLVGGELNGRIKDKTKHSPQIAFETKDKFIVDKVYTKKAKQIAKERLEFSEKFFDRFEKEINGEM